MSGNNVQTWGDESIGATVTLSETSRGFCCNLQPIGGPRLVCRGDRALVVAGYAAALAADQKALNHFVRGLAWGIPSDDPAETWVKL